jgi:hypothetical protein
MKILVPDDRTLRPVARRGASRSESADASTTIVGRGSHPMVPPPFEREDALLAQPAKKP